MSILVGVSGKFKIKRTEDSVSCEGLISWYIDYHLAVFSCGVRRVKSRGKEDKEEKRDSKETIEETISPFQ